MPEYEFECMTCSGHVIIEFTMSQYASLRRKGFHGKQFRCLCGGKLIRSFEATPVHFNDPEFTKGTKLRKKGWV